MAAKKGLRWFWLTDWSKFDHMTVGLAFDLLRYDCAKVESNAPTGYFLFSGPAENLPYGPEIARLATHGAKPDWVSYTSMTPDRGSSEAWAWYHQQNAKHAV